MKFYVTNSFNRAIPAEKSPAVRLVTDNWDDYGTKCQFHLSYFDKIGSQIDIGAIKILHWSDSRTVLPSTFEDLSDKYIALGQDVSFYSDLVRNCGDHAAKKILEALNDIAWQPSLAEKFETLPAFRNAFLRFNSAQKARRFGRAALLGQVIHESYQFSYKATIPGAEDETEAQIDFDPNDELPGRIVAIIGRNATGKTQYLSLMANDLVQIRRISEEKQKTRDRSFSPRRPIFNRVISVSYSAFDKFARPRSKQASYVYCGILSRTGGLSRKALVETYRENLSRIRELERQKLWLRFMKEILGDRSDQLEHHLHQEIGKLEIDERSLSLLSSGQAILSHFITSLVAWLEEGSIVLFDEPETHLHPNAVASLMNVFNELLVEFDSYALVATHSPVVIQEIPGKRVIFFEREGDFTMARKLEIESFGESISELTRHVFETIEIPNFYRKVLSKLSEEQSLQVVEELFEGRLSMNALSFLMAQYIASDYETPD